MKLIPLTLLIALAVQIIPVGAAELIHNPTEISVQRFIQGQSPTLVLADRVNVRMLPTIMGTGGVVFARLFRNDQVYVLSCEGFAENHYWVRVYIPELKEIGYVSAEFLQNNFNHICDRTRRF
ncbi:hypothetical protein [Egbenema bharatensis]|uniref:hypothetical protein n=1 Tax=Egbenema bharatensis TaxID=3463334 RepID=UPI003A88857D